MKKICTKENPMPSNSSQVWIHPDSTEVGVSGCGDNGAISFFVCDNCGHDYMGLNMKTPEGTTVQ